MGYHSTAKVTNRRNRGKERRKGTGTKKQRNREAIHVRRWDLLSPFFDVSVLSIRQIWTNCSAILQHAKQTGMLTTHTTAKKRTTDFMGEQASCWRGDPICGPWTMDPRIFESMLSLTHAHTHAHREMSFLYVHYF